ncbi:hypothetical protein SEUCBS140593_003552 [Sporothrix eucalyptigena]|uniref:FAD-binding FR-type domain-containing protein n=1 Tax=Sporothrix eucalyptigena TaxID=1812306 RepID=A0ABP0BFP7_9PEZI
MVCLQVARLAAILRVVTLLSILSTVSAQTGTGIIGYGITYWRDLCCQACYDSLSALYLNCTTFMADDGSSDGMDMGGDSSDDMMGMTDDACRNSNTPWLQTMAYCIQSECNSHGYTDVTKQEKCFLLHALDGDTTGPSYQDSLPATAPTVELAADAMWLNETSLVNADLYYSTYGTEGNFADSEYYHTKYAMTIYLTTIGVIVAAGVFAQLRGALPGFQRSLQTSAIWAKLQQFIFMPALFGASSRLHEPLPANIGYVPSRVLSLFIAVFIILNIVLSSVSFSTFSPSIYWNSPQFNLCEFVGNRTGTLSLVNISMAILFAGRNNLLLALTGWSQSTFLTLHRWAARVGTVQAVVHSIVYTLAYFEPGYDGATAYAAEVAMPFYWWGIVATIAFSLAASIAVLPMRTRLYEIFLVVHIVLAILALIGCWYHLVPHFGFTYGYQTWLYICFAFWAFDRVARVGRLLFYSRVTVFTAPQQQATIEAVPGTTNLVHVIIYPRTWNFGPGQHSFLYFPSLGWGKGWESHPFSVAKWSNGIEEPMHQQLHQHQYQPQDVPLSKESDVIVQAEASSAGSDGGANDISQAHESSVDASAQNEKDDVVLHHHHHHHQKSTVPRPSIEFLVRTHTGMTAWLRDHAVLGHGRPIDLPLWTEGPYAGHRATLQPLNVADTILCVVGGIGITHVLSIVQEYVQATHANVGGESGVAIGQAKSRIITRATRFILAWSSHEQALLDHVQERFLVAAAEVPGLEYQFWYTGDEETAAKEEGASVKAKATPGRMDVGSVIRSSLEAGRLTTVVVCGPNRMADEANRAVVQGVKDGFRVDSIEESFKW